MIIIVIINKNNNSTCQNFKSNILSLFETNFKKEKTLTI